MSSGYAAVRVTLCGEPLDFGKCLYFGSEKQYDYVFFSFETEGSGLAVKLCRGQGNCRCSELSEIARQRVPLGHRKQCPLYHQHRFYVDIESRLKGTLRIGVNTVIEERATGRLLLTRRNKAMRSFPGSWVFPGGHVDAGETLVQAAARELHEETSLRVSESSLALLAVWESSFPAEVSKGVSTHHHLVFIFHASLDRASDQPYQELTAQLQVQPSEVDALTWLSPAEWLEADEAAKQTVYLYDEERRCLVDGEVSRLSIKQTTTRAVQFIFRNISTFKTSSL